VSVPPGTGLSVRTRTATVVPVPGALMIVN
jgi:hypothetical protein